MSLDPRALESLLAFWTESGVDAMHGDEPVDRTVPLPRPGAAKAAFPPGGGAQPLRGADQQGSPKPAPVAPRTQAPKPAKPTPVLDVAAADPAIVEAARLAAAGATDLSALAAAIAAFEGCALKAGARQAVFSRGPGDAPVMIVGEAPGADEDVQGAPFVGRAGQLLDRMLDAAGLTGRVFVTNTVFWRPPGNRTPTPAEQAICLPFVERAIALVNPKYLLLVGGASAKAMLKKPEGILSLRGRWIEWKSSDGAQEIPALPTLHPSFLLRQPAAKRKSWEDLLMLAERVDRPHRPE